MGFPDNILWPLMVAVAWIMVQFHTLFSTVLGLDPASGLSWALSIVGLVVVIRVLLIPLFVRQIKASRGMQLLAPDLKKIQNRYKGKTDPASREAMSRETMELYRKHGTNPFASCLPILAQSPIFFALFRVLYQLTPLAEGTYANGERTAIGPLTEELAIQANSATIFDAQISSFFLQDGATTATRIVTVVLIFLMSATTFTTQKQLTQKNMPAAALEGPMAQQQKMLLYLLPLVFAVSGVNFPIGVLIYWTTTNLWSMGQQFYVIRRNPTPGSEAERQLKERRARKAAARGQVLEEEDAPPAVEEKPRGQRPQPKRKDRAKGTAGAAKDPAPEGGRRDAPGSAEPSDPSSPDGPASGPGASSGSPKRGSTATPKSSSGGATPPAGAKKAPSGGAKKPPGGAAKKPAPGGTKNRPSGGPKKPSSGGSKKPPSRPTN